MAIIVFKSIKKGTKTMTKKNKKLQIQSRTKRKKDKKKMLKGLAFFASICTHGAI